LSAPAKVWRHCNRLPAAALRALAMQRAWRGGAGRSVYLRCARGCMRTCAGCGGCKHCSRTAASCASPAQLLPQLHSTVACSLRARQPLLFHTSRQSSLPNKTLPARHLLPSLRLHAISPRPFTRQHHGARAGTGAFRLLGWTARESDLEGGRGLGGGCSAAQGLAPIVHEGRRTHQRTQFTQ